MDHERDMKIPLLGAPVPGKQMPPENTRVRRWNAFTIWHCCLAVFLIFETTKVTLIFLSFISRGMLWERGKIASDATIYFDWNKVEQLIDIHVTS